MLGHVRAVRAAFLSLVGALAIALLAASPTTADAQGPLPQPRITGVFQARPVIYDAQVSALDSNGRFDLDLTGDNLGPDSESHPGGFTGGYVHIYVRGINAHNQAGPWKRCADGDCIVYGGTAPQVIHLGVNPNFYIRESGSHLQFKVWISFEPDEGDDPNASRTIHSPWSPVWTVDRAAAGVTAPTPPKEYPTIDKIRPNPISMVPGIATNWTITVYGAALCGDAVNVILNGDAAHLIQAGHCSGVDDDGKTSLPAGQAVVHFVAPPTIRKPGVYSIVLRNGDGDSGIGIITVREVQMRKLDVPPNVGVLENRQHK